MKPQLASEIKPNWATVPRPSEADESIKFDTACRPEHIYLQYAAVCATPTMLLMLWMLGQPLWDYLRRLWGPPPEHSGLKFVFIITMAVVIATMIAGCFDYNMGDSEALTMFQVAVGCVYPFMDYAVV